MTQRVLLKTLVHARHVRSLEVEASSDGWQVLERDDERVVQRQQYTDWHRVERRVTRFERDVTELRDQGWVEP